MVRYGVLVYEKTACLEWTAVPYLAVAAKAAARRAGGWPEAVNGEAAVSHSFSSFRRSLILAAESAGVLSGLGWPMHKATEANALMLAALVSVLLDLDFASVLAAATVLLICPTCV